MALTYTPPGALGSSLPKFELPTVLNGTLNSQHLHGHVAVVMFICNHCPYVKAIEDRLLALARKWQPDGVKFLAICANDPKDHPEDSWEALKKRTQEKNYPFPYAQDLKQNVARDFAAVCTPDLFVYDQKGQLAYRGRLDDSWKDASKVRRQDLDMAIAEILAGKAVTEPQIPSMGCSIKWTTSF